MTRDELIDQIAECLMTTTRGYKGRDDWPSEWDKSTKDSQISMVIEDIEVVLDFLEKKHGYKVGANANYQLGAVGSTTYVSSGFGGAGNVYYYPPTTPSPEIEGVQTDVEIRVRTRNSPTISEVREFLDRLEIMGCEPTTELVGSISFTKRIADSLTYSITCGDCGEDDTLISEHLCKNLYDN